MTAVTVVVPTYDEAPNLERLVAAVRSSGAGVVVVDDSSPDGTGDIADRLAAADDGVSVVHRPEKQGLGPAYVAGFSAATDADVVCQMDADFSHDPGDVARLVEAVASGADLAIGSRYVPGGRTVGWAWHRRLLSRAGNRYAAAMLRLPVSDVTAGFRAWSRAALDEVDPSSCATTGYGFQVEMVWRAVRRDLHVVEVPIVFRERQRGRSKMSTGIAVEAMVQVSRWGLGERLGPRRGGVRPSR